MLLSVAVHEYANSTSAHDTVLEHRFSPTRTPFTSWQYANERYKPRYESYIYIE